MLQKNSSDRLFAHRDLRLVLPARALSFFGDSVALVVLSLLVAESGEQAELAILLAAFGAPLFLLAPLAGRIVDEFDSRVVLVAAGAVQVVASLGLVLSDGFVAMIGWVVLLQSGQAVTGPSWSALVPRIVGERLVGRAIGLQQSWSAVAGLAGAAVAGVLYDVLGHRLTLLVDTASFVVVVLVAGYVSTRRGRRYDARQGAATAVGTRRPSDRQGGWSVIRADAVLRFVVPSLWVFVVSLEAPNVVEVFLIRDELDASTAMYGAVMATFMLGQIGGPLLAGRVRTDQARVVGVAVAATVIGALSVGVGLSGSIVLVLVLFAGIGAAGGALNALAGTLVVTRPAEDVRGRVIATLSGTARGFSMLALFLGGLTGQLVGTRATFVICGTCSIVAALVVLKARSATGTALPAGAEPATMEA